MSISRLPPHEDRYHFILFEFDQEMLQGEARELLRALSNKGLPDDLFQIDPDGYLTDQYWVAIPGELKYGSTFDEEDLHKVLVKQGLSGRYWITAKQYPELWGGGNDDPERNDTNIFEFGPHVKKPFSRQISARMESNCQKNAARLADVLEAVKEWLDNGGPPSGIASLVNIQVSSSEVVRFNQVCSDLFRERGLLRSEGR